MIQAEENAGRLVLRLDRPEKANALTGAMLSELARQVRGASAREGIGAVILCGTGRVFSAGADLDEVREGGLATSGLWEDLSSAVEGCPLLTVAALNGTCAGGALGMVLACDLRVAVPEASFFYPVLKMGVLPQPSDPVRLARLVGPARAKLILLGASRIGAIEARDFGLVDMVNDDPFEAALRLTGPACEAGPERVAQIKRMIGPKAN